MIEAHNRATALILVSLISGGLMGCDDEAKAQRAEACASFETAAKSYKKAVKGYKGTDNLPALMADTLRAKALLEGAVAEGKLKGDADLEKAAKAAANAVPEYEIDAKLLVADAKDDHDAFKKAYKKVESLCGDAE